MEKWQGARSCFFARQGFERHPLGKGKAPRAACGTANRGKATKSQCGGKAARLKARRLPKIHVLELLDFEWAFDLGNLEPRNDPGKAPVTPRQTHTNIAPSSTYREEELTDYLSIGSRWSNGNNGSSGDEPLH